MTSQELLAAQAPYRTRYREMPAAARVTLRVRGDIDGDLGCRLDTDHGTVVAGMHPGIGGSGRGACPGDMLLEALVACAGVTLNVVATLMGIELRGATITAEADLDFRGALGLSSDAPVGFEGIRLAYELDTDASDEQIAALLARTETFCVVHRTLARPPGIVVSGSRAGG